MGSQDSEVGLAKEISKTKELAVDNSPEKARILWIRGQRILLDRDVAELFGVETRSLNRQVARNIEKFSEDFAFRLTADELSELRSQNAISSGEWGGSRYKPTAFTEHGVVMAATLLRSPRAIDATRFVIRTFVAARQEAHDASSKASGKGTGQFSLPLEFRNQMMSKVSLAIGHVLDAMVNPDEVKKAREEARGVLADSMKAIKAVLNKPGIENERKVAEIRKLMAESESIEVETDGKRIRNEEQQLALLAKKLSLIMQAEHFMQTGSTESFLRVLADLGQPLQITRQS